MKYRHIRIISAVLVFVAFAGASFAWGPRAQMAIVNTALNLMAREQSLPLTRLQNDIRAGVRADDAMLAEMFPDLANDPLRAIENEMALLSAVRRPTLDAYYAFRLGALGRVVATVTAPMQQADAIERSQYYKDADMAVDSGALAPAPRRVFETLTPFERVILEANSANDLIQSEYRSGTGFKGAASARLAADVSRSVNAVADIWWTIVTSRAVAGNISDAQLQRYVLKAYGYRIERGNEPEIDAAESYYSELTAFTPDMRATIGDMLYTAGFRERAVREYEATLAAAPQRRDVVGKIGDYYVEIAEEALNKNLLEEALAGFEKALSANALHPTAEQRRLEVAALIAQRDALQSEYQVMLKQADDLRELAEQEAGRARYAEAIALFQQSESAYQQVGDEFPMENQRRSRGLKDTQYRLMELKRALLNNAMNFSGAGFGADTAKLVAESSKGIEKDALAVILEQEYNAEIEELTKKMQPLLVIE